MLVSSSLVGKLGLAHHLPVAGTRFTDRNLPLAQQTGGEGKRTEEGKFKQGLGLPVA